MSYDDLVRRKRAERVTRYLEPHEMTKAELLREKADRERSYHSFLEMAEHQRGRMALCSAELSKPNRFKSIEGGSKTTPRKKICRIHVWDTDTNRRIRGHKYDWRMPSFKGQNRTEDRAWEWIGDL